MNFDFKIINDDITIFGPKSLMEFAKDFVLFAKSNLDRIKSILNINMRTKIIFALTDDPKKANFQYGISDFSGFFTDTGAFAYIHLNGQRSKDYMFKGLMHELVHYLYKYYVYGAKKERITWVDEGLATFLSNQKEEL